jgi:hypothetical protein
MLAEATQAAVKPPVKSLSWNNLQLLDCARGSAAWGGCTKPQGDGDWELGVGGRQAEALDPVTLKPEGPKGPISNERTSSNPRWY